jgi:hypothetical protein
VLVRLRCAPGPPCEGKLSLTAPRRGGKASAQKPLLLARHSFGIDGGKKETVKARLTRAGRGITRGHRMVRATLSVSLIDVQGVQAAKVRIVRAGKKHHG